MIKSQLWAFLTTIKYRVLYATCYQRRAYFVNNGINAITLVVSVSSIAGWQIWSQLGVLWSILIGTAQVLQVIKPFMPFSDRLNALKYYIPETANLYLDVELIWNQMYKYTEDELSERLHSLQARYLDIEGKYLGQIDIPDRNWIDLKVFPVWTGHFDPFQNKQSEDQ